MPIFPFASRASATPPGSSHYISNALITAKRFALGLEDQVRIQFDGKWEQGNPLYDWYKRHSEHRIVSMQFRKETKAPFFHEYITISLGPRGNGRCFRIDRRQLPDEQSPLNCVEDDGVMAFDTIEQIINPEDSMYNPSKCLVEVVFNTSVELYLVIRICHAISAHTPGRIYTIQKYNCYFYAQTLMLCMACWMDYGDIEYLWRPEGPNTEGRMPNWVTDLPRTDMGHTDIRTPLELKQPYVYTKGMIPVLKGLRLRLRSRTEYMFVWGGISGELPRYKTTIRDLQHCLSAMISAHASRVEQYKWLTKCSASQVEQDIKQATNMVWIRLHRPKLGASIW